MHYVSWYIAIGTILAAWSWNAHGSKALESRSVGFKFCCYMIYTFTWPVAAVWEVLRLMKK
jgi:hypothetical protein